MLDSSPVALPPVPRPLKRSASTASLPTPPRTHRRHARGRSRGSCDSDSDENVVMSSDEGDVVPRGALNKKRRMGETSEADANEEAFWLDDSAGLKPEPTAGAVSSSSRNDYAASKAPLLYRRLQAQTQMDVAPVSPPPSHRKAVATPQKDVNKSVVVSAPSTPRTRSATKRALLDSPNNPFVSPPQIDDSDTPSPSASSANPSPHTPKMSEKPTITYVFRGVKRVYRNPLYNHEEDRPYSPPPASRLPIEHPDYSPAMNCSPKLLFPEARRGKGKGKKPASNAPATKSKKRARSPTLSGDEADEDAQEIRPMKLDFGGPDKKLKINNTKTLDQELKSAGEPLSL